MSRPWWRKGNKSWYATINGKQELLCNAPSKSDRKGRDRADEELQRLLAVRQSIGHDATIVGVLEEFLTWAEKNLAQGTYYGHNLYLQNFLDHLEVAFIRDLKPIHVTKWVDGHEGWGNPSKRAAIISAKRALNWAVEQGMIERNPVATIKRPPPWPARGARSRRNSQEGAPGHGPGVPACDESHAGDRLSPYRGADCDGQGREPGVGGLDISGWPPRQQNRSENQAVKNNLLAKVNPAPHQGSHEAVSDGAFVPEPAWQALELQRDSSAMEASSR